MTRATFTFSASLSPFSGTASRLTRLSSLPSDGDPERRSYPSSRSGDAERLEVLAFLISTGFFPGESRSSSSVSSGGCLDAVVVSGVAPWFRSAVLASLSGDLCGIWRISSGSMSWDRVLRSGNIGSAIIQVRQYGACRPCCAQ